jgi:nicotinamidase-related amidase
MPDLTELVAPPTTAVLTVEMQRGVIGDLVSDNALRRAVRDQQVIPAGVSVNEALLGACLTAADLGYRIVLPVDAIAGVPEEYSAAVIKHTLALITNPATVDQVVAAWKSGSQ